MPIPLSFRSLINVGLHDLLIVTQLGYCIMGCGSASILHVDQDCIHLSSLTDSYCMSYVLMVVLGWRLKLACKVN